MDISQLTKKYRTQAGLTLEGFGEKLSDQLSEYTFTRQAVHNWESGNQRPEKYFLLLVMLRYGDWRRDWALDCLAVLQPDVFAPATMDPNSQEMQNGATPA